MSAGFDCPFDGIDDARIPGLEMFERGEDCTFVGFWQSVGRKPND